jgi:hypothetical protein
MWKRLLKKVLNSEDLADLILVVIFATADREYTEPEKEKIRHKAKAAILDLLS